MGQIRMSGFSRRALIATSILISVMRGKCANARSKSLPFRSDTKILVAYFTRSGNTQVIAGTLHRNVGGEIFEIRPARPYPEDYEQTVAQAKQERDSGYEPPLAATVPDFDTYDTVFLGFPIWGETAPTVIRSFLHAHDWKGKILRPFITHGGYGVGNSPSVLASHAVGATIEAPFVMEADQERRTLNEVRGWLNEIRHG